MPGRYAWLTFACALFVLNVSWCRAADENEHVHIKVRMPEPARKHKIHKPPQHPHIHHNQQHLYQPLQPQPQHHHYHKPQYLPHPGKYGRRAPFPHNHLDLGPYGDELGGAGVRSVGVGVGLRGSGMSEQLMYSPDAPQSPMAMTPDLTPNYGPAVFGIGGAGVGGVAGSGSSSENTQQHFSPGGSSSSTSLLTMPSSTQQLMQHMELMGALASAAVAAAGSDGDGSEESAANVGGGGASGTNTLLADDFLADMQRTYANGKFPATNFKRKKKYRGGGLAEIGDAAVTFPLSTPQLQQQHMHQQQQQHQQLLRQQFLQHQRPQPFYGVNYLMQQPKPQAQMLRMPTNNYNSYHQPLRYKNKQHYSNNDIYATATTDGGLGGSSDDDSGDGDGDDEDIDTADDVALFFSSRPTIGTSTVASSSPSAFSAPTTTAYHSASDYEDAVDDEYQQFGYKSNSNKNYFLSGGGGGFGIDDDDANEGVNPVSYQHSTTAYGAFAASASTPATVTHFKLRPHRQLHKPKQPLGFSSQQQRPLQPYQQQQFVTTAQPINVVGPTASDFDEHHPAPPPPVTTQQHHKYPVSPRYKKRKNRIKGKPNRNRIPTH